MSSSAMNRSFLFLASIGIAVGSTATVARAADFKPLSVPAATAYISPNPEGAVVNEKGVRRWRGDEQHVLWFGEFSKAGRIEAAVSLRLPKDTVSKLRLTLGEESHEAQANGAGTDAVVRLDFGAFDIREPGYQKFQLSGLNGADAANGDIEALELSGPAVEAAHFNLDPRRNAASVHLAYPVPKEIEVDCFYSEVTAVDDPVTTFYMACGFHRGYFGMQVNSPTERRIIFSVWDAGSGGNANDRKEVAAENYVQLIGKGDGVHTSVFGNEGTGGHSHLKYPWKTGEVQKFLVTAEPVPGNQTIYTGYYFHPERQEWMLISSMQAPKDGGYLKGLHGFSENFWGSTGHVRRKALYGNQWIRNSKGEWSELRVATFSHDPTGKEHRRDRFMGVENGQFFLSHGGFQPGFTKFGERFERIATRRRPQVETGDLPPR